MAKSLKNTKKSRKQKKAPVSEALQVYVKDTIKRETHRNIENKHFFSYAANTAIVTAANSTPTNVYLLPTLATGTQDGQRIGNEVRVVKGVITGFVNILPYSATLNPLSTPIMVRLWLVSGRKLNSNTLASYGAGQNFFEAGATSVGFQGNMLDMVLKNNLQEYIIHKQKTFRIGAGYASSTGPVSTGGYFDNSPFNVKFSFDWGKYCKSKLIFDDIITNICTNKNMFLVLQAVNADGSSTSINAAEYHFTNHVEYEDA